MDAYHNLLAMKADLLGEKSSKLLARADIPKVFADFADGDVPDDDESEACMSNVALPSVMAATKTPSKSDSKPDTDGGDEDMTASDVRAGLALAQRMTRIGLVKSDNDFTDLVLQYAGATDGERALFVAMITKFSGEVAGKSAPEEDDSKEDKPNAGAKAAWSNAVGVGVQEIAGSNNEALTASQKTRVGLIGAFASSHNAPLFSS